MAVVVPTWRRPTRLAFALEALAEQTIPQQLFEVVIVHDPADEATGRVLAAAKEALPLRLRTVARPLAPSGRADPRPATARNVGWRASNRDWVAFTDDDCRPAPGWLEAVLAAAPQEEAVVQGRTEPDPEERHLLGGLARSQHIPGPSEWYETCNIAYPRSLLERLGGFDESWCFGGEDTDLALRALAAGVRRVYADDALVWHGVNIPRLGAALREAARWDFAARLVHRHPRLRRSLHWGLFLTDTHACLGVGAGIALAAIIARRPPGVALAAGPYLALLLMKSVARHDRVPRAILLFCLGAPLQGVHDVVELSSTLRGAVRHRVPVA